MPEPGVFSFSVNSGRACGPAGFSFGTGFSRLSLERKADVPDARQLDEERPDIPHEASRLPRHNDTRQSEFAVSRGGLNQESHHNKHNHAGQSGHKPPKARG